MSDAAPPMAKPRPSAFPTEAILEDARDLDRRSVLEVLALIHRAPETEAV